MSGTTSRRKPPRTAAGHNLFKPCPSPARWNGPPSRRNRAEPLPLPRRQGRQAAPTELTGDRGPMVRIHLPPAASQRRTPFGTVRIQEFDARAVGLTPTGKRRLFTAHADSSRLRAQVINAAGEIWLASDATPAC